MRSQSYFHTEFEIDADIKNEIVPLQVNCVGAMGPECSFAKKGTRKDYYYIYVLCGKMVMPECTLGPGDVMVVGPECFYEYSNEGETSYVWMHYTGYEAHTITASAGLELNVIHHVGIKKDIIDCFKRLFREFIINDQAANMLSVCMLTEILHLTGRYSCIDKKKRIPLVAIEYIHRHYKENIDIDNLPRMDNMKATTFRRLFKQHTGMSPIDYIISQRMREARRLLTQTNKCISAVADEVGYHDQYYFSRIFKEKVGLSPLKYRTKNNEKP